jgi:aminomethyltransferase
LDETQQPLESGLAWTIDWSDASRDFIGRAAIEPLRGKSPKKLVGLLLEGRGVLRAHMPVRFANGAVGETTSGGFAPTMKQSIAFARVDAHAEGAVEVEIRCVGVAARLVKPPFVRHGKVLV